MNTKRMARWYVYMALLIIMGLLLSSGGAVLAARPSGAGERVDVFIGFHSTPGPAEQALVRGVGGEIRYSYWLVPAIAASVSEAAVDALQRNPRVTVVEPVIQMYAVSYAAELDNTWGVKRIQAGAVHPDHMGAGVKVAVIDSGIDHTHPDLAANYAGGWNYVHGNNDPMDDHGHGTHVAGTIAALRDGNGVVGAAPEAKLYALKVLDSRGGGDTANMIAALEWAVENGIQITNHSYGTSSDPGTIFKEAFDNAYAAGVLHVCAAGNSGNPAGRGDNVIYPARYDSCIAVASSDSKDRRASTSSTGPAVEFIAPGVSIRSTVLNGGYANGSGTSMASPHVAGVAALVWAVNPRLSNMNVRGILQATTEDLGMQWNHQGHGLVRADWAVDAALGTESPAIGTIAGMVTDSTAGQGIQGATVAIEGTSFSAIADGSGSYQISDIPVGDYSVRASAEGFEAQILPAIVNEDATTTVDFVLNPIPVGSIEGVVTNADDDAPISGATVSLDTGRSTTTDADGSYTITDVLTGQRSVTASAQGFESLTETVNVVDGETSALNFALTPVTQEPQDFVLMATGYKVRGRQRVDLEWSGATSSLVDVYRDGVRIASGIYTQSGAGSYTDNIDAVGGGSYTYQVCGPDSCSNEAAVTF